MEARKCIKNNDLPGAGRGRGGRGGTHSACISPNRLHRGTSSGHFQCSFVTLLELVKIHQVVNVFGPTNFSVEQILSAINTNLLSHVILTKYLVPFFKKKNKGKLVYIGSESALDGGKKGSLYSAAKFGLRGFTQSIRAEVASRNITVTLINPGMVKTNFFNNLDFQPGLSKKNSIVVYDIAKVVISILQMDTNTSVDEVVMNPIIKSVIKK